MAEYHYTLKITPVTPGAPEVVWDGDLILSIEDPKPIPPPQPSPDGTYAKTIITADGTVWTLGAGRETLRNGVHFKDGNGYADAYFLKSGVVYADASAAGWYAANDANQYGWDFVAINPRTSK